MSTEEEKCLLFGGNWESNTYKGAVKGTCCLSVPKDYKTFDSSKTFPAILTLNYLGPFRKGTSKVINLEGVYSSAHSRITLRQTPFSASEQQFLVTVVSHPFPHFFYSCVFPLDVGEGDLHPGEPTDEDAQKAPFSAINQKPPARFPDVPEYVLSSFRSMGIDC